MKSFFSTFHNGLRKTAVSLSRAIGGCFTNSKAWSEESYEKLEAALIGADFGVPVSLEIVKNIRNKYELGEIKTGADIIQIAKQDIIDILGKDSKVFPGNSISGLTVILLVGVNGCGKTTTAGKLAHMFKNDGGKVTLAACDTFRAAAVEQLNLWGRRVDCHVVSAKYGADPAAVAYDALESSLAKKHDYLIVDTAGRQHTHKGLMDELAKINRTIARVYPGAPQQVWLIMDGSIGSSALTQAKEFINTCGVNGIICTKLDGSYKGGMVVALKEKFKLPVYFIGLGEAMEDLQVFNPQMFADAVFEDVMSLK